MKKVLGLSIVLAALIAACAPAPAAMQEPEPMVEPKPMEEEKAPDIVDVAIGAGSFNILVAAVQAAGLEEALRGKGPFTVFAPNDEAFAKLPEGTVEALLADPQALADILLYHVISGKVMAADVADGLEAETLQGSMVRFAIHSDGTPAIQDALIVATDIEAFNGVIYVINTVILPPAE
jgi:uncharacterized surface protein with fasciclin (FAS1) repeats